MIEIRIEPPPDLQAKLQRIAMIPGALEKAAKNAVKRTLRGGKQDASRKIAQRYTIRAGVVVRTIKIKQGGLNGEMSSRGGINPLKLFRIKPKSRPRKMPAGGVFVQNVKGQGGYIRRGFLTHGGNVVERAGISRYPLRGLGGPSSPGMLSSSPVSSYITEKMYRRLQINLDHAASAIIGGFF